jgi:hypothetical protein
MLHGWCAQYLRGRRSSRAASRLLRQHSGLLHQHSGLRRQHSGLPRQHSGLPRQHSGLPRQHSGLPRQHSGRRSWRAASSLRTGSARHCGLLRQHRGLPHQHQPPQGQPQQPARSRLWPRVSHGSLHVRRSPRRSLGVGRCRLLRGSLSSSSLCSSLRPQTRSAVLLLAPARKNSSMSCCSCSPARRWRSARISARNILL